MSSVSSWNAASNIETSTHFPSVHDCLCPFLILQFQLFKGDVVMASWSFNFDGVLDFFAGDTIVKVSFFLQDSQVFLHLFNVERFFLVSELIRKDLILLQIPGNWIVELQSNFVRDIN